MFPQPKYLNLDYFYNKLFIGLKVIWAWILRGLNFIVEVDWEKVKPYSVFFAFVFLLGIIFIILKTYNIQKKS